MSKDLSNAHRPLGNLFSGQDSSPVNDSGDFRLTQQQVDFFHEQGYLAGIRLLNEQQLNALRNDLHELTQPDHQGRELWYEYHSNESATADQVLFHALGAWRIRESFHDLLWHPRFVAAAEQLLEGDVRFWHDQLFCKPAQHGGVVAWHQDYSYWTRTEPLAHLTCWIGLDDSTVDNGCLHYIPGSHRWPLLPTTVLAGDMESIRQELSEEQLSQFQEAQPIELKAGECSFHHPLMVHGSFANNSARPRRATILNVVRDGVCSNQSLPLLQGANKIRKDEPLGGRCFPLLSHASE